MMLEELQDRENERRAANQAVIAARVATMATGVMLQDMAQKAKVENKKTHAKVDNYRHNNEGQGVAFKAIKMYLMANGPSHSKQIEEGLSGMVGINRIRRNLRRASDRGDLIRANATADHAGRYTYSLKEGN